MTQILETFNITFETVAPQSVPMEDLYKLDQDEMETVSIVTNKIEEILSKMR